MRSPIPGLALLAAVAVLPVSCGKEAVAPAVQQAPPGPAEPERRVEASPAVKALLAEDPDLQRKLTEEEVRATLAAARAGAPPPPPAPAELPATATGERRGDWARLEDAQRARVEAHRQRLMSTTVYEGPDGAYHSAGCGDLFVLVMQPDKTVQRVYAGSAITLAHAMRVNMRRHEACGAPSTAMD